MKGKDLIAKLQEADPTGEIEVCIENADIHFVECMEAYWDGRLQVLIRNPDCKYYNIIGAKRTSIGSKIKLHPLSIEDALLNNPEMPIDNSEVGNPDSRAAYDASDEEKRIEFRRLHAEKQRSAEKEGQDELERQDRS